MTVSNSNPIQFWPTGEESYNEKAICGVYKECYCQKFNCDDTIKTQIQASTGGQFELRLVDESGGEFYTKELAEIDTGVYESSFNYRDEVNTISEIIAPTLWSSIGTDFTEVTATTFVSYKKNSDALHQYYQAINPITNGNYSESFEIEVEIDGNTTGVNVICFLGYNTLGAQIANTVTTKLYTSAGRYTLTIPRKLVQGSNSATYLYVWVNNDATGGGESWVTVTLPVGSPIQLDDSCGGIAQAKIYDVSQVDALAGFTQRAHSFISGTQVNWTLGSNITVTVGGTSVTKLAIDNLPTFAGQTYIFEYSCNFGANGANLYIILLDDNYNLTHVLPSIPDSGLDEVTGTVEINPTSDGSYIAFFIQNGGVSNTFTMHTLEKVGPLDTELYHSDCIEFKEDHECTEVITYSNSKNFDGLVFETVGSPIPGTFSLRIPAQFYVEGEPMEQEDHEKSNGEIVTLRQTIQTKRLLETGYMPGYMHQKLRRVLMMSNVSIDGKSWKKRDSYDDNPVRRYTMKKASVWLTEATSVKKNTL